MVFHWQDDSGAWNVGTLANAKPSGNPISRRCGTDLHVLIRHAHTGELEWVPEHLLRPYPSERIEEPTK